MKLIYQYMLGFLVTIVICLGIISAAILGYSRQLAYQQTWKQLEGYSDSLERIALKVDPHTGAYHNLTPKTIDTAQQVLANQKVKIVVFNKNNQETYPRTSTKHFFNLDTWNRLKEGTTFREKTTNNYRQPDLKGHKKMTYILKPWLDNNGDLVGAVWVGAEVSPIETNINQIRKDLLVALLISMIVAVLLSWAIASWQVHRINKLRQATKQVANGDFDVQIAENGEDEIDDLASDFNAMTQSLDDSQKEIMRQEERQKEFMADATHEMRTPLTTINGLLEGLAYDAIPKESRKQSIELMRKETKRLIRLVSENLDYEKVRTNQIPLKQRTFNASHAISDVVSQLTKKAKQANDEIIVKMKTDLPVYADYDRFVQIMFNIIQNSIQFTTDGEIKVTAERNQQNNGTKIAISDNGIGMTPDQVKNIWDRYYKADDSRKSTKYGESGLGMAIVKQLMRQHQGTVNVQSQINQGTTFKLEFFDESVIKSKAKK